MGTRNLTVVIQKEKPKIAQYGQWDGYPEGNGVKILNFVRKKKNLENLRARLKDVRFATKKDDKVVDDYLKSIGCSDGWMNMDQAEMYHKRFPYLSRNVGASILDLVANSPKGEKIVLTNSYDFAGDSLFCEWAYVIDLDNNKLECYSGFNETPLADGERFKNVKVEKDTKYLPIRLLKVYDLNELPTKRKFISELKRKEKEVMADVV